MPWISSAELVLCWFKPIYSGKSNRNFSDQIRFWWKLNAAEGRIPSVFASFKERHNEYSKFWIEDRSVSFMERHGTPDRLWLQIDWALGLSKSDCELPNLPSKGFTVYRSPSAMDTWIARFHSIERDLFRVGWTVRGTRRRRAADRGFFFPIQRPGGFLVASDYGTEVRS